MSGRRIWTTIYGLAAVVAVLLGYRSVAVHRPDAPDSDWVLWFIAAVIFCLAPLLMVWVSRGWGVERLRRPSLDRHPFDMQRDPLQGLRVAVLASLLYFIGSCFALWHTDHHGFMLVCSYAALALGFFIGEKLVYSVYRDEIA